MTHEPVKHRPTKHLGLIIGFLVLSVAAIGTVILLIALLFHRQQDFQNASDYDFVRQYLASAETDTFFQAALPLIEAELTPYEKADTVKETIAAMLTPEKLTFARADSYLAEAPVYTLYAQEQEIFTLSLSSEKCGISGYPRWKVAMLSLSETCDLGREVIVEVPKNAILTVNGMELDVTTAVCVPYHALTEFEADLAEEYCCDRYTLGRFFLTPEISVVLDGYRLRADSVNHSILRYSYPSSVTSVCTLTVPYGAVVKLNGVVLSGQYLVESGIAYPYVTRFEADLPDIITSVVYQVSGLFREPVIEVISNGIPLSTIENGRYCLPDSLTRSVTICAPDYATVKLNGISLGASEEVGARFDLPILEGVTNHAKERPHMLRYHVSGLLTEPVITATDANGNPLAISPYYTTGEEIVFSCTESDSIPEKELKTLRTFAKAYIKYMYSGTSGLSDHYNTVISMTPSKTPAYTMLKEAYKKLYKTDIHKNIKFGDIEALHYYPYSDTAYSAILKIPFTSKINDETITHEVVMEVLYVYAGNIRRIVHYQVLKTSPQPTA